MDDLDHKHGIIKSKRFGKEEEYIAQQEAKLIKEHTKRLEEEKKEAETKRLEEEKKKLKELHYMRCPKCGQELQEISFTGVMVDVCQDCMGMWLDHGELESIILKEAGFFSRLCKKVGLKKIEVPVKKQL